MKIMRSVYLILILMTVWQCKKSEIESSDSTVPIITVDTNAKYQHMDGIGASLAYYTNWFVTHQKKQEIYDMAFGGLKLDILRVMTSSNLDYVVEFAANAKRSLGYDIPILATSWAPAKECKSNNKVNGADGTNNTLRYAIVDGKPVFDYSAFANWWVSRLTEFKDRGIYPTYISIQNEPKMDVGYESCLFAPQEITSGDEVKWRAGYDKAFQAVYDAINASGLPMPQFIGPEGISMQTQQTQDFCDKLDLSKFYAVGYHTYCGDDSDSHIPWLTDLKAYCLWKNNKTIWQTEYSGAGDWINQAVHIHNNFTVGNASAYFYWCLLWSKGAKPAGLIDEDNPWQNTGYYVNEKYFSIKHFSYFIAKGDIRIGAEPGTSIQNKVRISAFLSADSKRISIVVINTSEFNEQHLGFSVPGFESAKLNTYQSTDSEKFKTLIGQKMDNIRFPVRSVTTLELVK